MTQEEEPSAVGEKRATDGRKVPAKAVSPPPTDDIGTALRNAFRATVAEDVPAEMLDLLRKLD